MHYNTSYAENIHSYVNNINTHEGGTHLSGFRRALTRTLKRYADESGMLAKEKVDVSGDDFREGLTAVISVKVMPNEAIDMDLKFHSPENSFKSLISLIPAIYYQDFNDLKSSGEFKLNGLVQGRLVGDIYPSFDINLNVREGYFQYPDLPSAVSEVNIDFGVKNQSRDLSGTEINMWRACSTGTS